MAIIIDYDVIQGDFKKIRAKVMDAIEDGWQPLGSLSIHYQDSPGMGIPATVLVVQAVVKYARFFQ